MSNIQTEVEGAILRITINRPEKKNALTTQMYTDLANTFEHAEANPKVRVVLLHGNGDSFTAGNDLEDFLRMPWSGEELPAAVRFMLVVANATKVVIAAVHGSAVGIGTTILLHCDLVYAADGARFMMPFVNLGIVPEAGSTMLVPRLVGHQRAAELLMLAAPLTARRAYELGLVNAVIASHELLTTAMDAARQLAAKPAGALRATKQLLKQRQRKELDEAMREELRVLRHHLGSPETKEALTAFLEKRKPDFSKFQ